MSKELAFPIDTEEAFSTGMTLRDYFAAKAMAAIIADPRSNHDYETSARFAYKVADAMLIAREQ